MIRIACAAERGFALAKGIAGAGTMGVMRDEAMDSFDLLGVPARFDLNPATVRGAFLKKIAAAHPDRLGSEGSLAAEAGDGAGGADGDAEGGEAEKLNAAKVELENPETRAAALLRRLGGKGKDEDRALPAGFLMQMMETRERIDAELDEAVKGGANAARAALRTWENWANDRRAEHIANVAKLFAGVTETGANGMGKDRPDERTLKAIRTELNAWRYVERLVEQLRERVLPESTGGGTGSGSIGVGGGGV